MRKICFLSVFLAMLMLFTSCKTAGTENTPAKSPTPVPESTQAPETTGAENEKITFTLALKSNANVSDFNDNAWAHALEEAAGIDLDVIIYPATDAETKLQLQMISNEKLPDLISFGPAEDLPARNEYAASGALLNLDAYFEESGGYADNFYSRCEELEYSAEWMLNLVRCTDGSIYAFPTYEDNTETYRLRAFINKGWLDTLSLPVPTTVDELTQTLTAFRDGDPNGNGIADEIPISGNATMGPQKNFNPLTWLQCLFIYHDMTEDRFLAIEEIGDTIDVSYDKDAYRDFLKYANMLVDEKLLDELVFTQSYDDGRARFKSDTEVFGMMIGDIWMDDDDPDLTHWIALDTLTGADGKKTQNYKATKVNTYMAVSSDCEHPDEAVKLCMMTYDGNYWYLCGSSGVEGVNWRYAEAGEKSYYEGYDPTYMILQSPYASIPQNITWEGPRFPYIISPQDTMNVVEDPSVITPQKLKADAYVKNKQYAPSACVGQILYTEEETEQWGEIRTTLQSYITEAEAKFCIGQLDPNSDEDWNAYLNELNKMKYKELLAMDNAAYLRTNGITK